MKYERAPGAIKALHPILSSNNVERVVISNVENQQIKSHDQMSVRVNMFSDNPSLYERSRDEEEGRTQVQQEPTELLGPVDFTQPPQTPSPLVGPLDQAASAPSLEDVGLPEELREMFSTPDSLNK